MQGVTFPSPEKFDDEYDDQGLEEALAKQNAKRSMANKLGTGLGLTSLGVNAAQIAFMIWVLDEVGAVSLVASLIACFVAIVVVKRMIIDMAPTHSKYCIVRGLCVYCVDIN